MVPGCWAARTTERQFLESSGDTTRRMGWEALLGWPGTRCSFQELDGSEAGPGEGMSLGAQDSGDVPVGQWRTEVQSTEFGIKLVWSLLLPHPHADHSTNLSLFPIPVKWDKSRT